MPTDDQYDDTAVAACVASEINDLLLIAIG